MLSIHIYTLYIYLGPGCTGARARSTLCTSPCPRYQVLYCTVLYCTILYCAVLYCTAEILAELIGAGTYYLGAKVDSPTGAMLACVYARVELVA